MIRRKARFARQKQLSDWGGVHKTADVMKSDENKAQNSDLLFFTPEISNESIKKEYIYSEYIRYKREVRKLRSLIREDYKDFENLRQKIKNQDQKQIDFAQQFIPGNAADNLSEETALKEKIAKLQDKYDENQDTINQYTILYSDKKLIEFSKDIMQMRISVSEFSSLVQDQQKEISDTLLKIERFRQSDQFSCIKNQAQIISQYENKLNRKVQKYMKLKSECQSYDENFDYFEEIDNLEKELAQKQLKYENLLTFYNKQQLSQSEELDKAQKNANCKIKQIKLENLISVYPIPEDATKEDIYKIFSEVGPIEGLMLSPDGYTPRTARIQFETRAAAIKAAEMIFNGFQINLEIPKIAEKSVKESKSKINAAPRRYNKNLFV